MLNIVRRGKKGIFQIRGRWAGERIRESAGTVSEEHAEAKRVQLERQLLDEGTYGKRATATFAVAVVLYHQRRRRALPKPAAQAFWHMAYGRLEVMKFAGVQYSNATPQTINRQSTRPWWPCGTSPEPRSCVGTMISSGPSSPRWRRSFSLLRRSSPSSYDPKTAAAILLVSFTGARASEACRVVSTNVDWEARKVLLRKTKNGKPRLIPLAPICAGGPSAAQAGQGPYPGVQWPQQGAGGRLQGRRPASVVTSHQRAAGGGGMVGEVAANARRGVSAPGKELS